MSGFCERERERESMISNRLVEIAYSSGKDSDVIAHLAKMAGIEHILIRKDTTIDPPFSNKHARDKGAVIIKPERTFFDIVKDAGLPNRWHRLCCSYLKEHKTLDVAVMGIRRDESRKRKERYNSNTECRYYGSKKNHVEAFYPILEWTDEDVREFIEQEHIQCHPLYYDSDGVFHPERRLGCIGCPLASKKKRLEQLRQYPKFISRYVVCMREYRTRQMQKSLEKGKSEQEILEKFGCTRNEYEHVALNIFCDTKEEFAYKFTGMFGRTDCKAFLEDYFKIDLP